MIAASRQFKQDAERVTHDLRHRGLIQTALKKYDGARDAKKAKFQNWQEAHVRYGAYQFDLAADRKSYKLHTTIRNNGRDVTVTPPLPGPQRMAYQFKLAVKDGWLRAIVDGHELAAEKLGADPSPWLMLHSPHSTQSLGRSS